MKHSKLFSLLTVPAQHDAHHKKVSQALTGLFVLLLLTILISVNPLPSFASSCGGSGERACCVTERIPSCNPGLHEVLGCDGDCKCGGANPFGALNSVGRCVPNAPPPVITACGAPGQRACCVTEKIPSCNPGAHEELGCTGNCTCGGPNPLGALKAIGHCVANPTVTACGGPGQRACCVTERPGQPCNPGFHEVLGCNTGNCTCGGPNPAGALKSIGHCEANPVVTACGGKGQRACCVTERPGQPCNQGLHEIKGCSGPNCTCGGPNPAGALKSLGTCEPETCGGLNQRACCVTERIPSCNPGLHEVLGCNGPDCRCGGANPLGALNSIGRCVANPPPPVISACGAPGQRACCVTEKIPSCNPGAHEEPGCTGNCACGASNLAGALVSGALKSIGHCVANPTVAACGGHGQRACCVTERPGQPCNQGLHETGRCTGPNCTCGGPNPAGVLKSIGVCEPQPCGGLGQRACCVTERPTACNLGLFQVLGCEGDCKCGGANPLGALNAIGHCESGCSSAQNQLSKLEAELANARKNIQQFCSQGGTPPPPPQQLQNLQPAIKPGMVPMQRPLPMLQKR